MEKCDKKTSASFVFYAATAGRIGSSETGPLLEALCLEMNRVFPSPLEKKYTVVAVCVPAATLVVLLFWQTDLSDAIFAFLHVNYWLGVFLIPIIARLSLIFLFISPSKQILPEEERNIDEHRGMSLTLAGFSFSAFFALVIAASSKSGSVVDASIALMLISFLAFYSAFSYEGYKFYRWQVDFISAISEIGKMSLFLSILLSVIATDIVSWIQTFVILAFIVSWSFNFGVQLSLRYRYLRAGVVK